jgi:pimeloyl-ACP methyl ester carboxylesterase
MPMLMLAGCVSLRPFAEVRREQPSERFVEVDGRQVYVEQQGAGQVVVLLHGFGESSYSWRQVMPELARSFRVVAPDLNGFGWTERPRDPLSYTREGQERLVLGVLGALGVTRAQFVGHSYGGSLTLFLASRHPGLVRSMVLIDSAAPTYSDDRRSRVASIRPLDSLLVRLALTPRRVRSSLLASVYDPALVTPELVRAYLERLRVHGEDDAYYGLTARLRLPEAAGGVSPGTAAAPAAADGKAAGGAMANARAAGDVELETLALPALVVWGAEDRLIRVEAGRRAARRLPAGEFVAIPRCGHLPMEERPAELLGLIVPFLRRHGGGG